MKTRLLLPLLISLVAGVGYGRERTFGQCELGNQVAAVTGGINTSTSTPLMRSYPVCTVTVYITGTLTPATLYSDNSGTAKTNPFVASSLGYWFFYTDNGRYDVKLSGAGIPSPFTLGDILVADPTSFSTGVTSIAGTANQICTSGATGNVTVRICTNPTLPGTTTGVFVGPLTGNVVGNLLGNVVGNVTGNASTATALDHSPTLCPSGQYSRGILSSGNGTGCTVAGVGTGDVSSNTSTSVVNEVALFADTSGKLIKRATGTGVSISTTGVASYVAAGSPIQFLRSKPNVTGTVYEFAGMQTYFAVDYNFPVQTPGGSLSIGANMVTLTPCPLGLAGSDANHYLRISGGTGTAETVAITGGSCTSGLASGTVGFTAANNHTGAWGVTSASGGIREAILASGGNATIRLPSNTTVPISGTNSLIVDKQNLTIIGDGYGTVLQALAGQQMNSVIKGTAANGTRFLNFSIDGNRSAGGTNPTFGAGIECGTDTTGNCSHVVFEWLNIHDSANMGILVHDANIDVVIKNNYIHDNGGVTDGSGTGQAIFFYRASLSDAKVTGCIIDHNYISDNHNTITNAGPSGGTAVQGSCDITNNYYLNNYNDGGQAGCFGYDNGPCTFAGNTFIKTSTGLTQHTSGIESDASGIQIADNKIYLHTEGWCIAVEGASAGPGGLGAQDVTITGNQCTSANIGIGLLNAGGFVRGMTITGNRVAVGGGGTGIGLQADTAADSITATGNDFSDSPTPVVDGSVSGMYLSNNFPLIANLGYQTALPSANVLTMRCGQVAQVTGSTTINFIDLPAETAGTNGKGCQVTLIAASGATWSTGTGGTITKVVSPAVGTAASFVYDGTNWNPIGSSASLPVVSRLQYLRGNEITAVIEGANLPFYIAPDYNFPSQQPGGSVTIGSNTKTLTPCPLGVGGSDVAHYLYLSGGTGTAEAVLIAGGSCTSGATTGTIVFTAANTHSGAWTVTSATAGIQEAINILPANGGRILLPALNSPYILHQTITAGNGNSSTTSTVDGIVLEGDGSGNTDSEAFPITAGTTFTWNGPAGGTMVDIEGPISGMHLSGIQFKCNGTARAATGLLSNHSFNSRFNDFQFNGCSGYAIKNYAYGQPTGIVTGANNNFWEQISIYAGGSATASGWQIGAGTFSLGDFLDVAQNFFRKIQVGAGASGVALDLRLTDSLTFDSFTTTSGGTGIKVDEVIGNGFHFPSAITFNMSNVAGTSTVLDDTSWTGTLIGGWFWPYNNDNDTLDDPLGTNSWSAGVSNNGRFWGKFQTTPTVFTSVASSTAIASTNAETAFSKTSVLPAKSINAIGTRVRVTASGRYSTTGTPTMQLAMKIDGNPFSVVSAVTTPNNASGFGWSFTGEFVVRAPGASGTVQNGHGIGGLGGTTPQTTTWVNNFALDTTTTETVTVTALWSIADASNTIIMDELAVEILASGRH